MVIDPNWLTADVDNENNHYPRRIIPSRIESYKKDKSKNRDRMDLMHDSKTELKKPKKKIKKK